jgi:hypothetical protein
MKDGFRLVNAGSRRFVSGLISVLLTAALWAQLTPDGTTIVFSPVPSPSVDDWPKADISTVGVSSAAIKAFASTKAAETSPEYCSVGLPAAGQAVTQPLPVALQAYDSEEA